MTIALRRLLKVESGEGGLVFVLGLLLFGNSMAIQMSSVIAISGFLSADGANQFLLVLLVDMIVVLGATALQSLIIDRFDRVQLVRTVALAFAATFGLLWLMVDLGGATGSFYSLLYITSEQQILFFPLMIWALAGDLFSPAQTKRLFPVINSTRFIGRITGLAIIAALALLPTALSAGPKAALVAEAAFYLVAFALVSWKLRGKVIDRRPTHATLRETLSEGWGFISEVPMFRFFALAVLLISSTDILVEFRFFVVTNATFTGAATYESFFSLYRISISLLSFAISGLVVSRVLKALGVQNTLYLLPIGMIISAVLMLVAPGIGGAVIAMGLMQILRDTIYDSTRMSFFALVPNERRGRVNIFTDSYVLAFGTIIGIVMAWIGIAAADHFGGDAPQIYYLGYVVGASVLAIFAVANLRRVYSSSMLNWRLRRRKRANSVLDGMEL